MIRRFVERFCDEYWLIENYEEAVNSTDMWQLHHRLEVSEDGLHTVYSSKELLKLGLYYHRPAEELIFLSRTEHTKLHQNTIERRVAATGRIHGDEARKKMSEAKKGKPKPKYKWQDPDGIVHTMSKNIVIRYHPDWKIIEEQ